MCICAGCGKLIENNYYYCPWCGYSRLAQEKEDSMELRFKQLKARQIEERQNKIAELTEQLDDLEKELSMLVLSAQMAR